MIISPRSTLNLWSGCNENTGEDMTEDGKFEADLTGGSLVHESPCESVADSDHFRKRVTAPYAPAMLQAAATEGLRRSNKSASGGDSVRYKASAFLARSDSVCSSNIRDVAILESQRKRQFLKLQKQRDKHLGDLWAILCNFKDLLKIEGHNRSITVICQYHIDILQRMIAPMMADEQQLIDWLSQQTVDRLEKQISWYLQYFKGDKFKACFQEQLACETSRVVPKTEGEAAAGFIRMHLKADQDGCVRKEQKENLDIDLNTVPLENPNSDIGQWPLPSVKLPTREAVIEVDHNRERPSIRHFVTESYPSKRMCVEKAFCTEKESVHAQQCRQQATTGTLTGTVTLGFHPHELESANTFSFATRDGHSDHTIEQKAVQNNKEVQIEGLVESDIWQPVQLSMCGRCRGSFGKECQHPCPADIPSKESLTVDGARENVADLWTVSARRRPDPCVTCIPANSNDSGDFDEDLLGNRSDWSGATHCYVEEKVGADLKNPSPPYRKGFPEEDQQYSKPDEYLCLRESAGKARARRILRCNPSTHHDGLRKRSVEELSGVRKSCERGVIEAQLAYIESVRRQALLSTYDRASDHSLPSLDPDDHSLQ